MQLESHLDAVVTADIGLSDGDAKMGGAGEVWHVVVEKPGFFFENLQLLPDDEDVFQLSHEMWFLVCLL